MLGLPRASDEMQLLIQPMLRSYFAKQYILNIPQIGNNQVDLFKLFVKAFKFEGREKVLDWGIAR
ncbi:hypothetical protein BOTBODRAFT_174219 [Botryobasidium botryosum FD-172 SS1]|uniref:Uncharacterized protein n=1 Tax=Botryobasidium botryosum (strain FD-172 SS1) TaxID=930990 RepID=A0A067MT36_BOTB1|nr:hypothetical protein BOTBODRAFT_174219 [Botryobasidium botryosum FD-172 SS1]